MANSKSTRGGGSGLGVGLQIGGALAKVIAGGLRRREVNRQAERQHEDMDDLIAKAPPVHGSAAWATLDELRAKHLLRSAEAFESNDSILLGAVEALEHDGIAGWLHWAGQGHLMTVAPTRSGKSTTLIVPNLLRYGGSCVVLDPKGELYETTSRYRKELGEVYRIAPFERDTDAVNPIESLTGEADALALADLMLLENPRGERFFRQDAVAFLNGLIQFVQADWPTDRATLGEVRRLSALEGDAFLETLHAMARHPYRAVSNAGQVALGKSRDRGIPNLRDTLNSELAMWDDRGVQRATGRSSFRFEDLKDKVITVYVTVPFNKMDAFSPFLRVILATALDAMIKNPVIPQKDVLFVLDEFLSLGPFERFRDAIRTHAGAGAKLWFFLQNLAMLEQNYPTSWKAFLDAAVQIFFGTSDVYTGEIVSNLLGDTTWAQRHTTFSLGTTLTREDFFDTGSSDSLNVSHSVSLTARRLLTPAEVVQRLAGDLPDGTRRSIISIAGSKPIAGRLVPYMKGSKALQRVGRLER